MSKMYIITGRNRGNNQLESFLPLSLNFERQFCAYVKSLGVSINTEALFKNNLRESGIAYIKE